MGNGCGHADASCTANSEAAKENQDEKTPLVGPKEEFGDGNTTSEGKGPLLSRLIFGWLTPLLEFGNAKKQLDPKDLCMVELPENCSTDFLTAIFERHWAIELTKEKPSLLLALWKSYGDEYLKAGILKLLHDVLAFVGPLVLHAMINYLRDVEAPASKGLYLTGLVGLSQLAMSLSVRHYFFKCYKTGLRVRTAVVSAVYKKALTLSSGERQTKTVGEITNLMSIDANRLQASTTYLHGIWYNVVQIILCMYFLWQQLGSSCLAGIAVMIVVMPITNSVAQGIAKLQKVLMKARDERVNINSEVLGSMKTVKIQAWEEPFQKRIMEYRTRELKELLRYWIYSSTTAMIWNGTPLAVALSTFAAYVTVAGHDLEVASALTSLALFDILRFPIFMLPNVINTIAEGMVSINRVESFLLCEEQQSLGPGELDDNSIGVRLTNVSAAYETKKPRIDDAALKANPAAKDLAEKDWEVQLLLARLEAAEREIKELTKDTGSEQGTKHSYDAEKEVQSANLLCLKRVDFQCNKGELVAVVGGVGSGKSSLINAILGEVRQLAGTTSVAGKLSYFAQSPFILNATVKDNVLFSHVNEPFDRVRYKRALEVSALTHDLETTLPRGDMTEIGEKGITLSGGQKARVALARAVYHRADISVIDDALSAVDAHVAKSLFDQCLVEELLENQGQSVILVTNAIQYLNHEKVSRIIVLSDGRVAEQGSYRELIKRKDSLFAKFVAVVKETGIGPGELQETGIYLADVGSAEEGVAEVKERLSTAKRRSSFKPDTKATAVSKALDTTEEARSVGHVKLEVYATYAKAAGGIFVPFLITLMFASVEVINVFLKWWLTYWSSHADSTNQVWFLTIYALVNLASVVASFFCFLCLVLFSLKASKRLFQEMLDVIMRAPMAFFDTTPVGRVVNRFSKDIYTVDEELVMTLRSYLWTLMSVISTTVVISGVTPVFAFCLLPIVAFYIMQQKFFTATYRELKRLDSVNRSPLYALLGETIDGVATVRAFSAQDALIGRLKTSLDLQQHAYYLTVSSLCWLAVRLEMIGTAIIAFACLCSVLEHDNINGDEVLAGLYGLSISYALSVTGALNWSVRMASDLEANMVAVERVDDYCKLESEADRHTPADNEAKQLSWPSEGKINFVGAELRYRPNLPLVLKGLDIHIPASSKVGVVGRTGAGKSTLMTSLLRIVELDKGEILIDGINIQGLGLAMLRKAIAVIPQDPVLFSGTIRSNLDPFGENRDEALEEVLVRVGLINKQATAEASSAGSASDGSVSSDSVGHLDGLEDVVSEGGINFSVGQRQLLVIARALLCGANIVILDEATAAVDADTDAFIQRVLRKEFGKATTITVAHRLNTIMDSDFILVMADGRAAEFDTPQHLLKQGGMFHDLVQAAALDA